LVYAITLKSNQAAKLRAKFSFTDRTGIKRVAGEEWIIQHEGTYLPDTAEEVLSIIDAIILNEKQALHYKATNTFTDSLGRLHKTGEWIAYCTGDSIGDSIIPL
jgi:major vault protein